MLVENGLRHRQVAFGIAAAIAVLVSASHLTAQERPLMIFFDYDSALVSEEAQKLLDFAVEDLKGGRAKSVSINGHTDASEKASDTLSLARSHAVASVLIAKGIAVNKMQLVGSEAKSPLVKTAPGQKEPQNRRVEVVLKK